MNVRRSPSHPMPDLRRRADRRLPGVGSQARAQTPSRDRDPEVGRSTSQATTQTSAGRTDHAKRQTPAIGGARGQEQDDDRRGDRAQGRPALDDAVAQRPIAA